jgi:hypothetical protein
VEVILEGIDDDVIRLSLSRHHNCFCNRKGRDSIGKANLDHYLSLLGNQDVSQDIRVRARERNIGEVARSPNPIRASPV